MAVLGHASTGTTMEIYQHVSDSMQRSATEGLFPVVSHDTPG